MNIELTKLRSSRIPYNSQVVIPRVYVDDNNIKAGDTLDVYRGKINGRDAIVILPTSKIKIDNSIYKNLVKENEKQAEYQK